MAKTGRPKGLRNLRPVRGSLTAKVCELYDATDEAGQPVYRGSGEIAAKLKTSSALVCAALNRWRPDWRARYHAGLEPSDAANHPV